MDVHPSVPDPHKHHHPHSSGQSDNMQRRRTPSHTSGTNPRSIYSNPSPATSRGDSPTAIRGYGPGGPSTGGTYAGPYRMIPGKSRSNLPQKQIDILAPVPRRHLIDNSASSLWLGGDGDGGGDTGSGSPPPQELQDGLPPHARQRAMSHSPTPFPESPVTPISTLQSLHHQYSPTRARSPLYLHDSGLLTPTTAPAGTTKFPGQHDHGIPSGSSSSFSPSHGPAPHNRASHLRVSSQSFSTLYKQDKRHPKEREREGSVDPSSLRSSSILRKYSQQQLEVDREREREKEGIGKSWIKWMHRRGNKAWVVPLLVLLSTLVKFIVGLGSYSGHGTPPMYGDYEAQRHWMELTLHLPFRQWYKYDLQYWGLDYPPLTAYISWICGFFAHRINPSWVALDASRGIETETSKVFMRTTVVTWDMLIYVPALVMFVKTWHGNRSARTQELALLTLLFQPALLLIDFGHLQYNSVMLGFTLLAMNFFATGQDLIGAVCFVLSLGFKQMALYYAPAIGSYLLAKCLYLGLPGPGVKHFTSLGITTVTSFLVLFLPFYLPPFAPSITAIMDPITRIFPFNRGLFEDKVANFWCASNVALKWRERLGRSALVKLSAGLTAFGFLPSVGAMLGAGWRMRLSAPLTKQTGGTTQGDENQAPFLPLLPYALLTSAFSFFLFSFQVHEKTILVPLLPMTLLLSGAPVDSSVYAWGVLVNNIGVFSMWPLLKKDGLGLQYLVLLLLWNRLIGYNPLRLPSGTFVQLLSLATYAAAIGLHALEWIFAAPARYPDIYPVLNVLISTPVFVLAWLWSIKCGIEVGWAMGGLGSSSTSASLKAPSTSVDAGKSSTGLGVGSDEGSNLRNRTVSLGYAQSESRRRKGGGKSRSLRSRTSTSSLID